jgi:hypothetical protein
MSVGNVAQQRDSSEYRTSWLLSVRDASVPPKNHAVPWQKQPS